MRDDRQKERPLAEDASFLNFETNIGKAEAFETARADRLTVTPYQPASVVATV